MKGYVARKGDRYYAVIYEGIDPITGRERRRWHPAGTDLNDAETLAAHLARRRHDDGYERSSPHRCRLSHSALAALQGSWPCGQALTTPTDATPRSTSSRAIGRVPLRRLRPDHLERLYAELADHGRTDGHGGLNPKTIVEIHMILRRALDDAVRRGLIVSNPARIAHAPKRRPLSSTPHASGPPSSSTSSSLQAETTATTPLSGSTANTGHATR